MHSLLKSNHSLSPPISAPHSWRGSPHNWRVGCHSYRFWWQLVLCAQWRRPNSCDLDNFSQLHLSFDRPGSAAAHTILAHMKLSNLVEACQSRPDLCRLRRLCCVYTTRRWWWYSDGGASTDHDSCLKCRFHFKCYARRKDRILIFTMSKQWTPKDAVAEQNESSALSAAYVPSGNFATHRQVPRCSVGRRPHARTTRRWLTYSLVRGCAAHVRRKDSMNSLNAQVTTATRWYLLGRRGFYSRKVNRRSRASLSQQAENYNSGQKIIHEFSYNTKMRNRCMSIHQPKHV